MSGHTLAVNAFNDFLIENYNQVLNKATKICKYSEEAIDILNDVLGRTVERIKKSGFTNTEKFAGYVLQSVKHDYHRDQKRLTKRRFVDFQEHQFEVEQKLIEQDHNSQPHYYEIELVTKYLFEYIERFYPAKHVTLYKVYYTTENDTYRKIVQTQAGVTMSTVKNILSTMKTDVKRNLIKYIIFQETKEYWRDIVNYPMYQVSNKGNVRDIFGQSVLSDKKGIYLLKNQKGDLKEKSLEQLIGRFKSNELIYFKKVL